MTIQLSLDVAATIQEQVDSGRYASVEELIEDALHSLDERERRRQHLLALLVAAHEETAQGEVVEWTPELRRQLRAEAEAMVRQGRAPDPADCP